MGIWWTYHMYVEDFGKDLGNLSALKWNYMDSNNAEMKVVSA